MSDRRAAKKLADQFNGLISIAVPCGLMMWSVFNICINIMQFQKAEPGQPWFVAFIFILLTSVIPFAIGLTWLIRVMRKPEDK